MRDDSEGWLPRTWTAFEADERGVSEVIGFVLFFAIMVTLVGGGVVVSINQLDRVKGQQPQLSAVNTMETVRGSMYEIDGGAPYRSTEISVADGTLTYAPNISVRVTVDTGSGAPFQLDTEVRPQVYELADDTRIYHAAGAVVMTQPNGGEVVKAGPTMQVSDQRSIVPIINTTQRGETTHLSFSGQSTAQVVGYRWDADTHAFRPTDSNDNPQKATVEVMFQTPRYEAWAQYFRKDDRYDSVSVDSSLNAVTVEFESYEVLIRRTNTHVKYTK